MSDRFEKHVALPVCPGLRHVPSHPGYTCDEENGLRARVATHLGPDILPTIPASMLADTTFGPGQRNAA